ncbi:hypothetical protein [Bradyrhizobium sp. S69]|jgi:hypothetical protein|nr:hypothetical protein [Bradyrhizobium sp. S69]
MGRGFGQSTNNQIRHTVTKGAAILKVWTAIDRALDSYKLRLVQSERPKT